MGRSSTTTMARQGEPMDIREDVRLPPEFDQVQEASEESFPASDPPARTVVTGVGEPARNREGSGQAPTAPVAVKSPEPSSPYLETRT